MDTIVFDSDHPGARENRCFAPEYSMEGSGNSFLVELGTQARNSGFEICTADVFLKAPSVFNGKVFCITEMYSSNTDRLLNLGVIPFLCYSMESPLIAKDFYIGIKRLAGRFHYNIQFRGATERLKSTRTCFSPMYFPVDRREPLPLVPWNEREFLVLINRNKRAFFYDFSNTKRAVRSMLSIAKLYISQIRDPWLRSREIYKDRIESIRFFASKGGLDLYGEGWNDPIPGFSGKYRKAAARIFKGSLAVEEKLPTMSKYRFAICFENCSFPGYITEKIFDCFLAGCIPVYFGAPDITDFVPKDTFIDFRNFKSLNELHRHLINFPETRAQEMLAATREFLSSASFDKFDQKKIVGKIMEDLRKLREQE